MFHILSISIILMLSLMTDPLHAMFTLDGVGGSDSTDQKSVGKGSPVLPKIVSSSAPSAPPVAASSSPALPDAASSSSAVSAPPVAASSAASVSETRGNITALAVVTWGADQSALVPQGDQPSISFRLLEGGDNLPVYRGGAIQNVRQENHDDDDSPHPPILQCALKDKFHEQALLDLLIGATIPHDVHTVMSDNEFAELQSGITYFILSRIGAPLGDRTIGLCDLVSGSVIQKCFKGPDEYKEAQRRITVCRAACKANTPQPLNLEGLGLSFLPGKFGKLKGVTDLNLARNPTLLSFERLGLLTSLTRLNLFETGIGSLTHLKPLINLTELGLGKNWLESVEGIEGLVSLEVLDISHNKVQKLEPLSSLKALKILSVEGNPLATMGTLKDLPLTTLNVDPRVEMAPFKDDLEALLAKGCNIIYKGEDNYQLLKAVSDDIKSLGSEVKDLMSTVKIRFNQWWNQT